MLNQFNFLPPSITYSNNNNKLQRRHSNQEYSSNGSNSRLALVKSEKTNESHINYISSRYSSDFIEVKKLGHGGFGEVYKVS